MATKINQGRVHLIRISAIVILSTTLFPSGACSQNSPPIFDPGPIEPLASLLKVTVGDVAPDFILPSTKGNNVTLSHFRKKQNVVLTFIPAAWTPVCSGQWPSYHSAQAAFEEYDTVVLGISTDNIPTLFSWTDTLGGMWFPVLSDFWPHGFVAEQYGVLRYDGVAERALFVIDKEGIIRYIDVHDINSMPPLDDLITVLKSL